MRITDDEIWIVAAYACRTRNARLLGYCDAALRGGRRRESAGRDAVARHLSDAKAHTPASHTCRACGGDGYVQWDPGEPGRVTRDSRVCPSCGGAGVSQ